MAYNLIEFNKCPVRFARAMTKETMSCHHDLIGREVAHATVMALRADRPLTGSARDRVEQVKRGGVIGTGPGDVSRAEQRDHRNIERRSEMSRPRIGRDQKRYLRNILHDTAAMFPE